MKLSKKGELLALGSALYLLGLEVDAAKFKLDEAIRQSEATDGIVPATQELLDSISAYQTASKEFTRLEKRFLQLKKEIEML